MTMHKLFSRKILRTKQANRWQNQNKQKEIISSQVILSYSITRRPVRISRSRYSIVCNIKCNRSFIWRIFCIFLWTEAKENKAKKSLQKSQTLLFNTNVTLFKWTFITWNIQGVQLIQLLCCFPIGTQPCFWWLELVFVLSTVFTKSLHWQYRSESQ